MKASAKVEGLSELFRRLALTKEQIHCAIKKGVDRTALAIESDAKRKIASDGHIITGRLRSSIHAELKSGERFSYSDDSGKSFDGSLEVEVDELEAVAGTNVHYAPYIEFGTKYIRADSFLGWAAMKQTKLIKARIEQEIKKILNK